MTAVMRPRGPLPARVYWTRRLLLVALALALVFAVARLLGGGGSPGTGPSAQPVDADASPSTTSSASPSSSGSPTPPSSSGDASSVATPSGTGSTSSAPLARPNGRCATSDVVAEPSVTGRAYAARPVRLTLVLTTRTSPACTFDVSAESLVVKITSGQDRIWSTQDCTAAVPRQAVVLRRDVPATVSVVWSGLRSDDDCSRATSWVEQGYYHVVAAAFGADPRDVQFRLGLAPQTTRTASPTESPSPAASPGTSPAASAAASPTASPRAPERTPGRTPERTPERTPGAARR